MAPLTPSPTSSLPEQLRMAAALAHTAPSVVLELTCCNGERMAVGYARLDAQLTPCQLRCALLAEAEPGLPRLADAIVGVDVVGGLDHLGGGLYGRGSGLAGNERWFASTLPHDRISAMFADAPFRVADNAVTVRLMPDAELGVTAVRVRDTSAGIGRLDQIAYWALAACLVAELDSTLATATGRTA